MTRRKTDDPSRPRYASPSEAAEYCRSSRRSLERRMAEKDGSLAAGTASASWSISTKSMPFYGAT